MGDGAVNTSTIKVAPVDWNRPVADKTIATGNTVSQVQNPDVTVSVSTNPITPPNMIVAKATQETAKVAKAEAVKQKKPEVEVEISKYFNTTYLDLEEDKMMLFNQMLALTGDPNEVNPFFGPPLKCVLGKELSAMSYVKLGQTMISRPEIQESLQYVKENGTLKAGQPIPEAYTKKIELLAKRYVFFYASHRNLEDFGMDMDYLTIPTLDNPVVTDKKLLEMGYANSPLLSMLSQYDKFLSKYNGVSTVGKLGRDLNIQGVELYNLWKELTNAGMVNDYSWMKTDASGKVINANKNKWLEVPVTVNVKSLVAKIALSPDVSQKLETYLVTLQNGKKRDGNFLKKYEELKTDYNQNVKEKDYLMNGFTAFSALGIEINQERYQNYFVPKANAWIKEYCKFEGLASAIIIDDFQMDGDYRVDRFKYMDKYLEKIKTGFLGKNIPVGQEFLFKLLDDYENLPQEKKSATIYEIKYK